MRPLICLIFCLLLAASPFAVAATDPPKTNTLVEQSQLDRRAHDIAEQLRCLVCQGETVADSNSDLAADMREVIHVKLRQGWSEQQIIDFFVERYGYFVLFRPPLKYSTWALWFGPLIMLLAALAVLIGYLRKRARIEGRAALTPEETRRAHRLLDTRWEEDKP